MTSETRGEAEEPSLTLIENPQAAEPAHPAVPRGLRFGQELGGQAELPLQDGRIVDAPQEREQEARPRTRRIEAEGGVEIDDARPAVFGDEDVVTLAQVDVRDTPGVDLPHQPLQLLEHRSGLVPLSPAPAGDPLALDRLHEDPDPSGLAIASGNAGDALQPAEGPHLPRHLTPSQQAHRPELVA